MKIKVCGMRDVANIAAVGALKPDYMGFIFFEGSPRFAGEIDPGVLEALPTEIGRVGVFVDASLDTILQTAARYRLDAVQLHGSESPERCAPLRERRTVIKAFGIADSSDLKRLKAYENRCDYFLFDTKTKAHGGSGQKFDHSLLAQYDGKTPYFLSGGLSPDDAGLIASLSDPRCAGVDVNSRFETAPGLKDTGLLNDFMKNIRLKRFHSS